MKCPVCNIEMTRRKSKFGTNYWWGCPNWPACTITVGEHPDGTLSSTPCDLETKELRKQAHRLCDEIWGKWKTKECDKRSMYAWLKTNTTTGHFGHMAKKELLTTLAKLNLMSHKEISVE